MDGRFQHHACSADTEVEDIFPQNKGLISHLNLCKREKGKVLISYFKKNSAFQEVPFLVDELKIEVDCSLSRNYVEIDAVEIVGGILYNLLRNATIEFLSQHIKRISNENLPLLYFCRWMPRTI